MTEFPIVVGLETEYGIVRTDVPDSDPVLESMEIVRAYRSADFMGWNYHEEDPALDARGFRVEGLAQDEEERAFTQSDYRRFFSFKDMKSDRILSNGGRFYNDHTHPEFSTPECLGIFELLRYDRAGIEVLKTARAERERELGVPGALSLYRNNTDYHGHSYGCHENYLLPRRLGFDSVVSHTVPFLVARILLTGAGKYGFESSERQGEVAYQISQRADFMETIVGVDTMHKRPLVNSRDEPHADRRLFRRLHLIVGDANMSEWQTAMKTGMTSMVLKLLIRSEWTPDFELENPVSAMQAISAGLFDQKNIRMRRGKDVTALDILERYWEACERTLSDRDFEEDWVIAEWRQAMDHFRRNPSLLSDRVDWIAKKAFLERFREEENLDDGDPWLQSLDLEYHNIDPEKGLFWALEETGEMRRLTDPDQVRSAFVHPPSLGRARVRHAIVRRFGGDVEEAGWERIRFRTGVALDLPLFRDASAEVLSELGCRISTLSDPGELAEILAPFTDSAEEAKIQGG